MTEVHTYDADDLATELVYFIFVQGVRWELPRGSWAVLGRMPGLGRLFNDVSFSSSAIIKYSPFSMIHHVCSLLHIHIAVQLCDHFQRRFGILQT